MAILNKHRIVYTYRAQCAEVPRGLELSVLVTASPMENEYIFMQVAETCWLN